LHRGIDILDKEKWPVTLVNSAFFGALLLDHWCRRTFGLSMWFPIYPLSAIY
jgi:hypothetical protein